MAHSMYETFFLELKSEGNRSPPVGQWDATRYVRVEGKICNGGTVIVWARNDHLTVIGENNNPHATLINSKMWKNALPDMDVLLLSKGADYLL